jgi:hypothetical protein
MVKSRIVVTVMSTIKITIKIRKYLFSDIYTHVATFQPITAHVISYIFYKLVLITFMIKKIITVTDNQYHSSNHDRDISNHVNISFNDRITADYVVERLTTGMCCSFCETVPSSSIFVWFTSNFVINKMDVTNSSWPHHIPYYTMFYFSKVKSKITVIIDNCIGLSNEHGGMSDLYHFTLIFHIIGSYLHADGVSVGAVAHLVSPPLYNMSCLSFYYYMFGSQIGRLNVYTLIQGNYTQLLQLTGNQGNRWYKSKLALGQDALYSNFSVSILLCMV